MSDVHVPKLNNNDQSYVLTEWLVKDGDPVSPGDPIVTVETSKAAEELESSDGGTLWQVVPEGAPCAPGETIARVVPAGTPRAEALAGASAAPVEDRAEPEPVITARARTLIDDWGIHLDRVYALGLKVVRTSDIEKLGRPEEQPRTHTVPPVQAAVGRTVVLSHRTVPAAYTAVEADVGAAVELCATLGRSLRKLVGLPEVLIASVARRHAEFPMFFAEPLDDTTVRLSEAAHVGVTIDIGRGLFVPVVRGAARLSLAEVADVVTSFRDTALTGRFQEGDLSGGTITVTLHNDPAVTTALPLVFHGQTCALSLGGARTVPAFDTEGNVVARTVASIGVAFDHRFINGSDAVGFLKAVKKAVEAPEPLTLVQPPPPAHR